MVLIFEGLDCSGKTTLADLIAHDQNFKRYKEYKELKNLVSFHDQLNEWSYFEAGSVAYMLPMFSAFDDFVIDRFHFSCYAYTRFFKRQEFISFEKKEDLMFATQKDIRIVYCDITEKTFDERHEIKRERKWEFNEQKRLFEEAITLSRFPVLRVDTNNSVEESFQTILENLDCWALSDYE
jgi:thymidylate kinase